MRSRTRFVASLLALVAMVVSLTGATVVPLCAMAEAHGASAVPAMEHAPSHGEHASHSDAPAPHQDRGEHRDGRHCPFGPAGPGCSGAVSLPPAAYTQAPPRTERAVVLPASEAGHPRLWVTPLFRPPRA